MQIGAGAADFQLKQLQQQNLQQQILSLRRLANLCNLEKCDEETHFQLEQLQLYLQEQ